MSPHIDHPPTPPLSPSASPTRSSAPSSSSNSSSSLSLPLSHLCLESNKSLSFHSSEPPSPQGSRPNRFGAKLPTMDKLDEDAVMLDDEDDDEDDGWQGDRMQDIIREDNRATTSRPPLLPRQSSYSKRHASVDTPREVPFAVPFFSSPIPQSNTSSHAPSHINANGQQSAAPTPRADNPSQPASIDGPQHPHQDQPPAYENVNVHRLDVPTAPSSSAHHRISRPLPPVPVKQTSVPDHSSAFGPMQTGPSDPASSSDARSQHNQEGPYGHQDMSAHAGPYSQPPSNPVFPFNRPFSSPNGPTQPVVPTGRFAPPNPSGPAWYDRSSTASLPLPSQTPYFTLPSMRTTPENGPESAVPGPSSVVPGWSQDPSPSSHLHHPHQHPLPSPPQPRVLSSAASTISTMSYAPPPPPYTPSPVPMGGSTMITRSTSEFSSVPPAPMSERSISPAPSMNPSRSLPPPAPPTILAPPPAPPGPERGCAPHEPFLSHAPPPADSWIAVETMAREYNLVVRLPGFRRDGITLATRRRRILHLVADSWDAGGGHFERRIAFGYDADLSQVRAEFDGEMLRVIIPRRVPSITWYGEARE